MPRLGVRVPLSPPSVQEGINKYRHAFSTPTPRITTHDRLTSMVTLPNLPHLAALQSRDYRYTWGANALGGASMWTFLVASQWFVQEGSDSSGLVGLFTFASMIPFLIVSPLGGLLADQVDRKKLALFTLIGGLAVVSISAILAISGSLQFWHLCLLAFFSGSFRATQEPAVSSLVPNLVPSSHLLNAITLNAATRHGSRVIGMSLLMLSRLSNTHRFSISEFLIASTIFASIATWLMTFVKKESRGKPDENNNLLQGMIQGINYIYSHRKIGIFIFIVAFHCSLVMSFDSILPILTIRRLQSSDEFILAFLVMGFGLGSLIGTFLLSGILNDRCKGIVFFSTVVLSGISPICLGLSTSVAIAFSASFFMGASQSSFMAMTSTYVQSLSPDWIRGRISSLYILHAGGIMAFANLGYGYVADFQGASLILITTGLIFLAIITTISFIDPTLKDAYTGQELANVNP